MIKQSFTLRVLVISFLVLAFPLLIDSFIFFQNSYYTAIKDAKMDLREAANFRAFTLTEIQPVKQVLLRELEYFLNFELDSEKLSQELAQLTHDRENFQVFILDLEQNKIIASSLPAYVGTFMQIIKAEEGSFVRYIYSHQEERFIPYTFVFRVIKSDEKPIGILVVTADVEAQLNAVLSKDEKNKNVKFALLNPDGVAFASTDKTLIGSYFDPLSLERQKEIIASKQVVLPLASVPVISGDDPLFFEFIFNDQVQIAYRAFTSDFGVSIVAYSSKEEFFEKAIRNFLFIYFVYGLILVIGGGVTYWFSLLISRPLTQLSYLMGEVSEGNLDVRFEREPLGCEINILGGIFNNTLVDLLENIQQAEDERVKKETYQRELAIGRQVQRSLLPSRVPKIKGAQVSGTYLPALEVGGDFYGYMPHFAKNGEETLVITVADAAGKGIFSCLYALSARSLLRSYTSLFDHPGEVLSLTNNAFMEDTGDTGMFVTMFTGIYHIESKILTYYSCGHVPPIVRRADGYLVTLEHSGMALGLKESKEYRSDSIQLESGDLVIFYTNGLTEAVNAKHQHFSERRLRNCLQHRKWPTAQEAVDGLRAELQTFTGSASQEEEVIIVALKVD